MICPKVKEIINEAGRNGLAFKKCYVNEDYPRIQKAWNDLVKAVEDIRKIHKSFVINYIGNGRGTAGTTGDLLDLIIEDTRKCKSQSGKIVLNPEEPTQAKQPCALSLGSEENQSNALKGAHV